METEHLVLRSASSAVAMRTRSSKNRSTGAAAATSTADGANKPVVAMTSVTTSTTTTTTAEVAVDGDDALLATTTTTTRTSKTIRSNSRERAELHTFERLHQEGFAYLADNSYIHSGYRLNYSVRDCFLSLFELHNETLNVWTHMIGSIIFVLLMAYLALSSSALGPAGVSPTTTSANGSSNDPFVAAPAWCGQPQDPFVARGRHTPRLFFASTLPTYCPPPVTVSRLPEQQQKYYEVASVIFAHSLHQIPSLARFHDILESHLGDLASSLATQTEQLKADLVELSDRLSLRHVTDYSQVRLVKANVNARAEDLSQFLHSLASHVGADITLKYAVDELHGLADSVKNGLHILASVDTHDVPHWPIFVFLASAVICLTCSATFHLLFVHSKPAYFLLSRLDYAGITILIAGSFYPLIYYAFYCQPWAQRLYLTAITVMAALTFIVTLMPRFSTPHFLVFRTCLFLALGFFGLVPVTHLVWHFGLFDPHVTVMIGPLLLMGLLYTLGAVIYATRFPERFYPGRFDVWCSSHQLWHVCVVAAALVHFVNALQHYQWRWNTTCDV